MNHASTEPSQAPTRDRDACGRRGRAGALCAVAIGLATLLQAGAAGAAPSAADREAARTLLKDGDARAAAKDFAGALEKYEAAHAIMGLPSTGLAVARAQAALGLLVEARDSALLVTHIPEKPGESAPIARAREDARRLAGELEPRLASVQVKLEGPPPGAEVTVSFDGVPVAPESLQTSRVANPGSHVVTASAPGFDGARKEITLAEGQSSSVVLRLDARPEAAPAPAARGPEREVPEAPAPDIKPEGGHALSPLVWIGFGVGAAGIVTGSVSGIVHLTKISSIKDRYCGGGTECEPGYQQELDNARPTATIANIAFGVGLAGVAVGVVGLFLSPPRTPAADTALSHRRTGPWCEPAVGLASLGVRGGF